MKEVKDSELLNSLQERSKIALEMVNDALSSADNGEAHLSDLIFEVKDLNVLKDIFEKTQRVEDLDSLREVLKEDTIPMAFLFKDYSKDFWDEFQKNIDLLYI